MFVQTILLNWKPTVTEDAIDKALRSLVGLPAQNSEILDVYAGARHSIPTPAYSHAIMMLTKHRASAIDYLDRSILDTIFHAIGKIEEIGEARWLHDATGI